MTEKLIRSYLEQKKSGKDYSEIRKELFQKGYSKEEVSFLIREIDSLLLSSMVIQKETKDVNFGMIAGYVLLFGGGIITVATYFRIIDLNGYYIIAYGPILSGYFIILRARMKNRRLRNHINV